VLNLIDGAAVFYLCFILVCCAAIDFFYYKIPNFFIGCILVAFLLWVVLTGRYSYLFNAWLFLLIMGIGYGLCFLNLIGGGDVKLLAALSLWIGTSHILEVMFMLSIYGGGIAIIFMTFPNVINRFRLRIYKIEFLRKISLWLMPDLNEVEQEAIEKGRKMIPYGIAISASAALFFAKKWLNHGY
jgi:Flp pilus assembly protein protease CpaA